MSEKETTTLNAPLTAKDKLIKSLNKLLGSEMTALNQYTLHAASLVGYKVLYDTIDSHTDEEKKNIQQISSRILQLGGIPVVETIKGINYGRSVEEQLLNDLLCQQNKVKEYNDIILISKELGDTETAKLLETMLMEEEKHKTWIESQIELIKKKEVVSYLQEQKT